MNSNHTLPGVFYIGQELTHYELQETYRAMYGKPLPRGTKPREIAGLLAAERPLRFEFEVNRLRGHAFEAEHSG